MFQAYSEYLTKEALDEFGNFQLVAVICIWVMVKYLLKEK